MILKPFALFCQGEDLHLAELDWMALGLKRDTSSVEHLVAVLDQCPGVGIRIVELRLFVFDYGFAVDDVLDDAIAMNFGLDRDPVVAGVGLGT